MYTQNKQKGFGLVEIVVGIGIITIAIFALLAATRGFLRLAQDTTHNVQATMLLQEGLEAARTIRDNGWSTNISPLSPGTDYYFYYDGVTWVSTTTLQSVDNFFTRKFQVEDVYRACEDIRSRGGKITREPGPMKHGSSILAFVEDPDGYKVELLSPKRSD